MSVRVRKGRGGCVRVRKKIRRNTEEGVLRSGRK
jgi:hypothetical protein